MSWLRNLGLRLRSLFLQARLDRDLDEELRTHLSFEIDHNVRRGMTPEDARRAALRKFGGVEQTKQSYRDRRGLPFFDGLLQDTRFALRYFQRTPAILCVALLSLALGIGANTAIFGLIDAVMLRMLPVQKPDELVILNIQYPERGRSDSGFTNPLWEEIRDRQDVFTGVVSWGNDRFDLARGGATRYVDGLYVSGEFFNRLGVRPTAGRLISSSDDQRGCAGVAVLSYGFWQEHYGGAEDALGSTLSLNGHPFQVIGVSAPGFYGVDVGSKFDVAIPVCSDAIFTGSDDHLVRRDHWWLSIMGRKKPGISAEQMNARLKVLSPQIFAATLPQDWEKEGQTNYLARQLSTVPAGIGGGSDLRERFGPSLKVLMGVVGIVLLIACANLASLMLARGIARNREIALRKALGASRIRLVRQLLTECLLLSLAGAALGVLFARWGSRLLVGYLSTRRNQLFLEFSLDGRLLAFTIGLAVLTGVLFGALPAFRSTGVSLTAAMKGGHSQHGEHRSGFRHGKWIVAGQIAFSLLLLVGAGLFLRSFWKLATLDIGFDRSSVLIVETDLKVGKVPESQWDATYEAIEARLRALPGVISAARSFVSPMSGSDWGFGIGLDSPQAPTGDDADAYFNFVSPEYFGTLRYPLLAGRGFNPQDTKSSARVAVVNESFARKFFPGQNPIGKYFQMKSGDVNQIAPLVLIVGLVKDAKYRSIHEKTLQQVLIPITQPPQHPDDYQTFELRTAIEPSALEHAVEDTVTSVSKSVPIEFHTLDEQVGDSMVQDRLLATLSAFFGGLALLLAMIGLYGAISYLVTQRQKEFGVRLALGAEPGSILRLVMRDAVAVLAAGLSAGLLISIPATRVLRSLLFGLTPRDSITMIAAVITLSAVGIGAAYLPARRASRVDPMVALRYE